MNTYSNAPSTRLAVFKSDPDDSRARRSPKEMAEPFSRAAKPCWIMWIAPFGRAAKHWSALLGFGKELRLLTMTGCYLRASPCGQTLGDSLNAANRVEEALVTECNQE